MKIALIIDHFDPHRGGAEQVGYQHAQRLLARGHEVHVVSRDMSEAGARLGVVPHLIGDIRPVLARADAAARMAQSIGADIVHDIGLGWYGNVFQSEDGSRLAQWEQKLLLLPAWLRPLKRPMTRLLPRYREFRRLMAAQYGDPRRIIVAVSKMCARDFERYHGVPPDRIRLVYHGTDNERFSPKHRERWRAATRAELGLAADDVMFLFVGHDFHRKGLATALRAIERLATEDHRAKLVVLGGHQRAQSLRLTARQQSAVILAGSVEDSVPFYAAADAFVLPTFYDPCSLSVAEAAASGLPSVTTRFNGAAELLTDGVDGYVVADPADDAVLAERLRKLMDPDTRRRMGEAARQLALTRSLDRNCDELVAIYHEILAETRPAIGPHGLGRGVRGEGDSPIFVGRKLGQSPA